MLMVKTEKVKALDLAKWFIKHDFDKPKDTIEGNSKLQNLIYFSQLIHLAKNGDTLFNDKIYASENGSVIEAISKQYYDKDFISEASVYNGEFPEEIIETLLITIEIFGGLSATELLDINYQQNSWIKAYNNSSVGRSNSKDESEINIDCLIKDDLNNFRELLSAYDSINNNLDFRVIKGRTYYFDPTKLELSDEIIKKLEEFNGNESAYTIYFDDNVGLVIY
ncbi:Panacea domain-containing protein [Alkalihalobacillus sp. TS-13]|uniref:Panacea domain-containing protein n=1 Tax=Alkalihalobacillus sp. TS-13 TaxID=2842455 RepID=UPI001C88A6D8|nr:type II toxin-antitoxin system antitoxin SocA domain-containing protein [Alkalihalobacillus sp. TS-13]